MLVLGWSAWVAFARVATEDLGKPENAPLKLYLYLPTDLLKKLRGAEAAAGRRAGAVVRQLG